MEERNRQLLRHMGQTAVGLLLCVLAGDLLYLYFIGAWYDPIKAIEITELVILSVIVVVGLLIATTTMWRAAHNK